MRAERRGEPVSSLATLPCLVPRGHRAACVTLRERFSPIAADLLATNGEGEHPLHTRQSEVVIREHGPSPPLVHR